MAATSRLPLQAAALVEAALQREGDVVSQDQFRALARAVALARRGLRSGIDASLEDPESLLIGINAGTLQARDGLAHLTKRWPASHRERVLATLARALLHQTLAGAAYADIRGDPLLGRKIWQSFRGRGSVPTLEVEVQHVPEPVAERLGWMGQALSAVGVVDVALAWTAPLNRDRFIYGTKAAARLSASWGWRRYVIPTLSGSVNGLFRAGQRVYNFRRRRQPPDESEPEDSEIAEAEELCGTTPEAQAAPPIPSPVGLGAGAGHQVQFQP